MINILKEGIYLAKNDGNIFDTFTVKMRVKETEKSYIFELTEFDSRYGATHIEDFFSKSKRVVLRKNAGGHALRIWSEEDFTFYPYQVGQPYYFRLLEQKESIGKGENVITLKKEGNELKDKAVYRWSRKDAVHNEEIEEWKESYLINCDCARVIERTIAENYKDNRLSECAKQVIDVYGFERVNWWTIVNKMDKKMCTKKKNK